MSEKIGATGILEGVKRTLFGDPVIREARGVYKGLDSRLVNTNEIVIPLPASLQSSSPEGKASVHIVVGDHMAKARMNNWRHRLDTAINTKNKGQIDDIYQELLRFGTVEVEENGK